MTQQSSSAKPTVYRGAGAFVGGGLVLLACLAAAGDLLVADGLTDRIGTSILLLVAAFAFAYGVYPAAFSGDDALVVRNPFRTITLPWPAVTELSARLSFVAHIEVRKFTVWAVPVSLHERRKAERLRLKELGRVQREARRGGPERPRPGRGRGESEYIERLSYADQAIAEMTVRREQCAERLKTAKADETEQSTAAAAVQVRWAPLNMVLVGAAVLALILSLIL